MSTIFRRIFQVFLHYILEEILLVILVTFFYIQPLGRVRVVSTLIAYTLLVLSFNSKKFQYGCRVVLYIIKKYKLEEILALLLIIFFYLQPYSTQVITYTFAMYMMVILLLNKTFLREWLKKVIIDLRKEYLYSILILIVFVLLAIWRFDREAISFIILFLSFALYNWDSRVVAGGALVSLASCPILLILKQDSVAEQMAIYAYYFLAITVILQIIEYVRNPEDNKQLEQY